LIFCNPNLGFIYKLAGKENKYNLKKDCILGGLNRTQFMGFEKLQTKKREAKCFSFYKVVAPL